MSKKKVREARNPVIRTMIRRNQKAGPHIDKFKDREKYLAREKVEIDESPCIFPECEELSEYVSPDYLCKAHWQKWWEDGMNNLNYEFWDEILR